MLFNALVPVTRAFADHIKERNIRKGLNYVDVNQYLIVEKTQAALQGSYGVRNIQTNDNQRPTELNFEVGPAKLSVMAQTTFVRARCDLYVDETDDDDKVMIIGSKIAERVTNAGFTVNQVTDKNHITIMSLVQYKTESRTETEDTLTQKLLMFCSTIKSSLVDLLGLELDDASFQDESIIVDSAMNPIQDQVGAQNDQLQDNIMSVLADAISETSEQCSDPEDIPNEQSQYSSSTLNDLLAQIDFSESELVKSTQAQEQNTSDETSPDESPRKKKRRRKRNRNNKDFQGSDVVDHTPEEQSDADAKDASNENKERENTEPVIESEPEVPPMPQGFSDDLTPKNYEEHPELHELRARLYAQAQEFMDQAEARANAREQKLDAYKVELDRMSENIISSQEAFNREIEESRQKIIDEETASKQAIADEKQQALDDLQKERDDLDAKQKEYEFQMARLDAAIKSYQSDKAELDEDRKMFEQRSQMNENVPEFIHDQLMSLQEENGRLNQKLDETASVRDALEDARLQIAELKSKMEQMVPAEMASVDPQELTDLRSSTEVLTEENKKIQHIMNLQKSAIAAFKEELTKSNNTAAKLKESVEQYKTQLDEAKSQSSKVDSRELDSLKDRVRELLDENNSLQAENASKKEAVESLEDKTRDLQDELNNLRDKKQTAGNARARYSLDEATSEMEECEMDVDIKPGNGHTYLVGMLNGCTVNVDFERDYAYIEKKVRNAKRQINTVDEWNQDSGVVFNYWCSSDKIMCRVDYTARPNDDAVSSRTLSSMIMEVCSNFDSIK